ncbi:sterol desaturase family protein [Candidatus Uabimicrobium sp. HlEnr_7]|uniref:sterol desaturase family protein n=1 Tax=Candidatus Uabimicrobium helgolandensis TaxID=3095367 RepID=UPI003555DE14
MQTFLDWFIPVLQNLTVQQATFWFLLENIILFISAVIVGKILVYFFAERRVADIPTPISALEITLTISTIIFNTIVTLGGWLMWKYKIIEFRRDSGIYALLDVVVLFMAMDFCMYILHRVAHHRQLYRYLHGTHHLFDKPRPVTLFALNPFEVIGFGVLWLAVISVYDASWLGMSIYLAINVFFGTVGHLGVEPLPNSWLRLPAIGLLTTSTFHAQHHQDIDHNFGFYTLIWDRLFGTISPEYYSHFGRMSTIRKL